jgi:hypothetical protein
LSSLQAVKLRPKQYMKFEASKEQIRIKIPKVNKGYEKYTKSIIMKFAIPSRLM